MLFACPKRNIFKGHKYEHLLSWKKLTEIFPWNVLFLIGGGLAIARGFQVSTKVYLCIDTVESLN